MDGRFHVVDILARKTSKPEKATWSAAQHAASMELRGLSNLSQNKTAIVLIDDVTTDGGTLQGARMIVEKGYPQATVISLAIGG
jgi:adenine/guanine phosphoribosyltransferase-like PRPP-binding protein